MLPKLDLEKKLSFIRKKRNGELGKYTRLAIVVATLVLIAFILILIVALKSRKPGSEALYEDTIIISGEETLSEKEILESKATVEQKRKEAEREKQITEVINSYSDLGIVSVDDGGYLNIREKAEAGSHIAGKLFNNSACEILSNIGSGWYHISSGGFEGYVSSEFVLTGEDAIAIAKDEVTERVIVNSDKVNIRSGASTDSDVVGIAYEGERYRLVSDQGDWLQTDAGFINSEFCEVRLCLNEARKLDLKSMVLNLYDNLGISNVTSYLNVRDSASESGKIIGKMTPNAACDIIEEKDGWYKMKSGKVSGYVKSDYILTGQAAKDKALEKAELMAIVTTDVLNVRSKPSTESPIWTQISNSERYVVVDQLDGWVQIELGDTDENGNDVTAYASADYVEVRYALNEAIKFSPLEEAAANAGRVRSKLVNYALQFVGNPYVWGGTSLTKGCDCSGFTMQVYKNTVGISLPHYSGDQSKMGKKVTTATMRPGDLIFYANASGTVNHVAIYIGNGQIVHAASKKSGIKISSYNYRAIHNIRSFLE